MEKASLVSRLIALIVDNVVLWVIGFVLGMILGDQGGWLGFAISFAIGAVYQAYFLSSQNGQTIGKKLLGIRVVKTNGSPVDPVSAVLRYIGYYINTFLLFIGWLWAIPDPNDQGFHDKIAGTYVVKA